MTGRFIDNIVFKLKKPSQPVDENTFFVDTTYGRIRILDTKSSKPILINVPDGPNVIEHQMNLIKLLSKNFRVICFEYPGLGMSYPNANYNYSIDSGSNLLLEIINILKLEKVSLLFTCSNGYYALNLAQIIPDRIKHIFLTQTPSISSILQWTKKSIPSILEIPIIGQTVNQLITKKVVKTWYKYSLPKENEDETYTNLALASIKNGGCFCLSSLVQGLKKDSQKELAVTKVPVTLVWGAKDFTHRKTDKYSIREHIEACEVIEFSNCGHFPELEDTTKMVKLINERVK